MGVALRCPTCGATGESGMKQLGQDSAFEIRGQWKGKPVRMCNSCGNGLMLGLFGAKRIDNVLWTRMQQSWDQNFGVQNIALQVTCHGCERTGEAAGIRTILSRNMPPAPQFVLVGLQEGFKEVLAWCTLCPALPPSVTQIRAEGDPKPFTEMPELLFLPAQILHYAMEQTEHSGATNLGIDYFLEIAQQLTTGPMR